MATRDDYREEERHIEHELERVRRKMTAHPSLPSIRIDDEGLVREDGAPVELHYAVWEGNPRQRRPARIFIAADPAAIPEEPWEAAWEDPGEIKSPPTQAALYAAVDLLIPAAGGRRPASAKVVEALARFGPQKDPGNYRRPRTARDFRGYYRDDAGIPHRGKELPAAIVEALAVCFAHYIEPDAKLPAHVVRHERATVRRTVAGTARI